MTIELKGSFTLRPRNVSAGGPIRARDQNEKRQAVIQLIQQARNRQFMLRPRPWAEVMLHEIQSIQDDYLTCRRIWRSDTVGLNDVFIAKPDLLRASVLLRNGVSYVYITSTNRTASAAGEDDEDQYVTPDYLVGDFIEVTAVRNLTGVAEVDAQRVRLIDKNVDGRAWATLPAT